jgi:hypothetical protein
MPLADVVNVLVLIGASPIGLAAFSTPLVAADLTTPQQVAFGSDDVREVTPATWRAVMTEIGVASNEDLYLSLRTMFSQVTKPSLVLLGLRADPVAQVVTYTIPAVPPDGTYTITIDGQDCSFAASSSTQTQVRDGLITAVDAGRSPARSARTPGFRRPPARRAWACPKTWTCGWASGVTSTSSWRPATTRTT